MIFIIDALAGAGKTYWAVEKAKELVSKKQHVLFCSPSTDLQYEMATRLGSTPYKIINYMESKDTGGVTSTISNYLKNPYKNEVLIITHSAFKNISNFPKKKNWTIFIDEEISAIDFISFNLTDASNYQIGCDLEHEIPEISSWKCQDEGFMEINPKHGCNKSDINFLKSLCYSNDMVYPSFKKFIQLLINPNMQIYADTGVMTAFRFGSPDVEMWAELNTNIFNGFKNLYLMGARIQNSQLISYLKLKKVPIKLLDIPKRFSNHNQPIIIKWMSNYPLWSKNYYNQQNKVEPSITNFELFDMLVGNSIGEEKILLQNNKGNKFKYVKNPNWMPFEVKGLNQYSDTLHYAEGGAYIWPPAYQNQMTALGFDSDEILLNKTLDHAYQGLMRGSLRNGTFNNNNNIIFLPTEKMAQNMRNIYFPNAILKQIEAAEYFFK